MGDWWGNNWHDVLEILSTLGTVAAAALAVMAIRAGNKQAKKSADNLVRERRIDFELDHITAMSEAFQKGLNVAFTSITITSALRLLPLEEFANIRAFMRLETTDEAIALLQRTKAKATSPLQDVLAFSPDEAGATLRDIIIEDMDEAIRRRLAER